MLTLPGGGDGDRTASETRPMLTLPVGVGLWPIPPMPNPDLAHLGRSHCSHPSRAAAQDCFTCRSPRLELASRTSDGPLPAAAPLGVRAPRPAQAAIAAPS
jgi:hypothetical protein